MSEYTISKMGRQRAHFYLTLKSLRLMVKCTGTKVLVSVFSTTSAQNVVR